MTLKSQFLITFSPFAYSAVNKIWGIKNGGFTIRPACVGERQGHRLPISLNKWAIGQVMPLACYISSGTDWIVERF